jgi:hypothetical protein
VIAAFPDTASGFSIQPKKSWRISDPHRGGPTGRQRVIRTPVVVELP